MIIRKLVSALSIMAIAGSAAAGVVKVDFPGGMISPGASRTINLDELSPSAVYKLSCVLTSDHVSGRAYNLVQITTPENYQVIGVDAEETSPGSHQYKLPSNKNNYIYGNIFKDVGTITITNLDDTDSVLLSSCHAVGRVFGPRNGP